MAAVSVQAVVSLFTVWTEFPGFVFLTAPPECVSLLFSLLSLQRCHQNMLCHCLGRTSINNTKDVGSNASQTTSASTLSDRITMRLSGRLHLCI